MKKYNYLPDVWGAIGILAVLLMLEILIVYGFYDVGIGYNYGDPRWSVVHVFAFGIVLSVLMHFSGLTYRDLFHPSHNSISATLILLSIPIVIFICASFFWMTKLAITVASWFPEDQESIDMLYLMMNSGIVSIIAICLIAPFVEEMLFRGIILRGFLGRYSPEFSIVVSSLLFGLFHMNIYQIPGAFMFGLFLGWLFYASRSLWPCIFAHAFYNASVYYLTVNFAEWELNNHLLNLSSMVVSAVAIYLLYKILNYRPSLSRSCDDGES